ncbi:hypothetical protein DW793_03190 [Ruminococcus sp. AM31-15AC]|nr:hypothetical protein DW793_03190 [Ruminococcus sp. AM31-15AC]
MRPYRAKNNCEFFKTFCDAEKSICTSLFCQRRIIQDLVCKSIGYLTISAIKIFKRRLILIVVYQGHTYS